MKRTFLSSDEQPLIVKYSEAHANGICSQYFSRYAIGYILHGTKCLYDGDRRYCIKKGEVFFMGIGHHYMEDTPEEGQAFEQIMFYLTPANLQQILLHLNLTYGLMINNEHQCRKCTTSSHLSMPAWTALREFFLHANNFLKDEEVRKDVMVERIKLTELVYLLASHEDCCIKTKLLQGVDVSKKNFEQIIYEHVFKEVSVEKLSEMTHRSLTSFKKEFKRHFHMSPHKWYIRRRLMHARLLLLSTAKSISEIGQECAFSNTSHFIKLFKKEYLMTPSSYRHSFNRVRGHGRKAGEDIENTSLEEQGLPCGVVGSFC